MHKTKRTNLLILLTTLLLAAVMAGIIYRVTNYTQQHEIRMLEDGWDATVQGRQVQTDALHLLSKTAGIRLQRGDKVSISRSLPAPEEELPSPTLFLDVRYAAVEVFLDGEKLFSRDMDAFEQNRFISSQYYYVDLPDDFAGKEVMINYYFSENGACYDVPAPRLGTYEDLLRSFICTYRYPLLCGIFMLVFGAFFLIVSLFFTELIPELQELVDDRRIALGPAVELSYLPEDMQRAVYDYYTENEVTPSYSQANHMKKRCNEGTLTPQALTDILNQPKPNQVEMFRIPADRIRPFLDPKLPKDKMLDVIVKALEYYARAMERKKRDRGAR